MPTTMTHLSLPDLNLTASGGSRNRHDLNSEAKNPTGLLAVDVSLAVGDCGGGGDDIGCRMSLLPSDDVGGRLEELEPFSSGDAGGWALLPAAVRGGCCQKHSETR